MIKKLAIILTGILALSLGACAAPGNLNGLGSDPMTMVVTHKNPDYGVMTTEQYKTIVKHAVSCKHDVDHQTASLPEVMVTNGVVDAASSFGGTFGGYQAEASILGATLKAGAAQAVGTYAAAVNGAFGAANGLKIKSNATAVVVGNCTNGDIHDPLTARGMGGVHVYASTVRTNNSSRRVPNTISSSGSSDPRPGSTREPMPEDNN